VRPIGGTNVFVVKPPYWFEPWASWPGASPKGTSERLRMNGAPASAAGPLRVPQRWHRLLVAAEGWGRFAGPLAGQPDPPV